MDVKLKVKVNGKKLPVLLVFVLLLLGLKTCIDIFRKHVLLTLWRMLEGGWKGGLQSLTFIGSISTQTDQSSIIVENWPSMK